MLRKIGKLKTRVNTDGLYTCLMLLLWSSVAVSQVKFTASVTKNQVATGETFEVTFSLNANAESFSAPSFGGLEVVGGPNQSSSMSSVNGNTTMSLGVSYDLVATKTGIFTIGPATIIAAGKKYTTSPITIQVVKGAPVQQNTGSGNGGGFPGTPNQAEYGDVGKSIFIRAVPSKTSAYRGEQIALDFRLYTRIQIEANQLDKMPDFTGFWNEDVKNTNPNILWRTETYKGQQYRVTDIKQIILFADHAGDITIDPMLMTFIVDQPMPAKDLIDQVFGNNVRQVKYQAKSNKVIIHVKPLPDNAALNNTADAVGKFAISASLDKHELKTNETLNYKITVTGSGNLKLMKAPVVDLPPGFEKYDPKTEDSIKVTSNGVSGYRIYNYLVIPRNEGTYPINPVKFSYFNPGTGKYETLVTKSFSVKVNKGVEERSVTANTTDQQGILQLGNDIKYIKTGKLDLSIRSDGFYGSLLYYLLLLLGPISFCAVSWHKQWNAKRNSDIVKLKSRRAVKVATKHLASAEKELKARNSKAFYQNISQGLYGYLNNKLNIPVADMSKENIAAGLESRNVDAETTAQLLSTLDLCEMARYAPVSGISENEVFQKAKNIIYEIEEKL